MRKRFYRYIRRIAGRIIWWTRVQEMKADGTFEAFKEQWRRWKDEIHTP